MLLGFFLSICYFFLYMLGFVHQFIYILRFMLPSIYTVFHCSISTCKQTHHFNQSFDRFIRFSNSYFICSPKFLVWGLISPHIEAREKYFIWNLANDSCIMVYIVWSELMLDLMLTLVHRHLMFMSFIYYILSFMNSN
jgi:hypothetical protein